MNDIITAATSGLFVEVGKVIEHMKAQQERIADLERQLAEASAPAVEQQPVAFIGRMKGKTHKSLLWPDMGPKNYDNGIEYTPLYTAPQAADTDKVREADAWMTEDGERVVTNRTMEGARRDGGAMLSSMDPYSVALVRARSMAAQAPVREVPEGCAEPYRKDCPRHCMDFCNKAEQARAEHENDEFRVWWSESGREKSYSLQTQDAAHAAWQERSKRDALPAAPVQQEGE